MLEHVGQDVRVDVSRQDTRIVRRHTKHLRPQEPDGLTAHLHGESLTSQTRCNATTLPTAAMTGRTVLVIGGLTNRGLGQRIACGLPTRGLSDRGGRPLASQKR